METAKLFHDTLGALFDRGAAMFSEDFMADGRPGEQPDQRVLPDGETEVRKMEITEKKER